MTQADDPASVIPEPSPRRRRRWPAVLLGVLSLLLLLAGFGFAQGMHHDGCCAIDCEAYPDVCEENARRHVQWRKEATINTMASFAGSALALGGAVVLLRRR